MLQFLCIVLTEWICLGCLSFYFLGIPEDPIDNIIIEKYIQIYNFATLPYTTITNKVLIPYYHHIYSQGFMFLENYQKFLIDTTKNVDNIVERSKKDRTILKTFIIDIKIST